MTKQSIIIWPTNMQFTSRTYKVEISFTVFQNYLDTWFGKQCMYNLCKFDREIRK